MEKWSVPNISNQDCLSQTRRGDGGKEQRLRLKGSLASCPIAFSELFWAKKHTCAALSDCTHGLPRRYSIISSFS